MGVFCFRESHGIKLIHLKKSPNKKHKSHGMMLEVKTQETNSEFTPEKWMVGKRSGFLLGDGKKNRPIFKGKTVSFRECMTPLLGWVTHSKVPRLSHLSQNLFVLVVVTCIHLRWIFGGRFIPGVVYEGVHHQHLDVVNLSP